MTALSMPPDDVARLAPLAGKGATPGRSQYLQNANQTKLFAKPNQIQAFFCQDFPNILLAVWKDFKGLQVLQPRFDFYQTFCLFPERLSLRPAATIFGEANP